jgi:antitoxin PrlF
MPYAKAFIAALTGRGRITIPKEVRDALSLATGDQVEFVADERGVYRMITAKRDVRHLKGLVEKPSTPVSVEDMNACWGRSHGPE